MFSVHWKTRSETGQFFAKSVEQPPSGRGLLSHTATYEHKISCCWLWEFLAGWLQKAFLCFAGGGTALCVTSLGCHKCHRSTVQEQECNHLMVCLLVFPGHVLRNGGSRWVLFQAISVQGCWARFPASGTSAVLPAGMKPWCEKPSVPGALERLCWIHCSYKHSVIRFFRTKGEI